MYLTDLAFIEEGTPNYTEDGLVNFSKMRMVGPPPGQGGDGKTQPWALESAPPGPPAQGAPGCRATEQPLHSEPRGTRACLHLLVPPSDSGHSKCLTDEWPEAGRAPEQPEAAPQ